jgi:hypothetical protein
LERQISTAVPRAGVDSNAVIRTRIGRSVKPTFSAGSFALNFRRFGLARLPLKAGVSETERVLAIEV